MTAEMKWVDSSNVEAIGYDDTARELWVQFKNNETYIYTDVPASIAEGIFDAPSKGSYLNRIIKPTYSFRRP